MAKQPKPKPKAAGKAAKKPVAKKAAPKPAELRSLPLVTVTADPALQPREGGSPESLVDEYAEAITAGDEFPPLIVYEEADAPGGPAWWLSEGFTRYAAYLKAGKVKAKCEVRPGTRADALLNSCGSNRVHGLRRTNADKRRAVGMLLTEFPKWSDRKVADAAGVHHQLVGDVRTRGVHPEPVAAPKVDESSTPKVEAPPSAPPVVEERPSSPPDLDPPPPPAAPPAVMPFAPPPRPAVPIESRPAASAEGKASPSPASYEAPASEETGGPCDQLGRPLTNGLEKLAEVFEARDAVRETNRTAGALISELKTLDAEFPVGGFLKRRPRFLYDAERIAEFLRLRVAPFCVCPLCDADDAKCPTCGGKGWLARAGYEQLHPAAAEKARSFGSGTVPDDSVDDRAEWSAAEWAASGRDSVGNTIPPRLRDDFACDDLLEDVRDLKRIGFQLSEAKGYLHWLKPEAHEVLAQALRYVEDSVPFAVCVACQGKGCAKCLMSGYHPKWSHDAGSNNTKKAKPAGD